MSNKRFRIVVRHLCVGFILALLARSSFRVDAQTNINFTAGTLEIHLNYGDRAWTAVGAAGSIRVVADGVLSSILAQDVNSLDRLPPTNTVLHVRFGGSTIDTTSPDLLPPIPITLVAGKTNRVDLDLCGPLGLVMGRVSLNGIPPPAFRLVNLFDSNGGLLVGARTDTNGVFRALIPAGSGTGQAQAVDGQGRFSYSVAGCETTDVGEIALTSAALRLDLFYNGKPVADLAAAGTLAVMGGDAFGRILSLDSSSTLIPNLASGPLSLRVGYGALAFEPGSTDLVPQIAVTLVSGTTNVVAVELGGGLGLLQGRVVLNGKPAPAGKAVSLFTSDGRVLVGTVTGSDGSFRIMAPVGAGKGHAFLVDEQGDFSYNITAGRITDLGDLNIQSGALQILLSYHGTNISTLQAGVAIRVNAAGLFNTVISDDTNFFPNLIPGDYLMRIGYGSAVQATETDFIAPPVSFSIVAGATNIIPLDLCGPIGMVQGRVYLNGNPVPAGTPVNLFDYARHGLIGITTDATGTFRALVPAGPGRGRVTLVSGQGDFSFHVAPCETTVLTTTGQNQIPILTPVPPQEVMEGNEVQFTVQGTDPDGGGQPLTYSLEPGAPVDAVVDPVTGVFKWTPPLGPGARTVRVLITGTDSGSPPSSDSILVTINVKAHLPPQIAILTPTNGLTLMAPASILVAATATGLDAPIGRVEFYAGGQRIATTLSIPYQARWQRVAAATYDVLAVAVDQAGVRATSAPVRVVITSNRPPVLDPITVPIQVEGREVAFTAHATDPDSPAQSVSYRLESGAPIGATLDPTTGQFRWTPPLGPGARTNEVVVTATDTGTPPLSVSQTVVLIIRPHLPPTVSIASPTNGSTAFAPATLGLEALISPGDDPVGSVKFYHDGTRIGTVLNSPYQLRWPAVPVGNYTLTVIATDVAGVMATSAPVHIAIVVKPNLPPTVALTQPLDGAKFTAPATVNLAASASDPDGSIASVEFWNGTQKVGSSTTAPYAVSIKNLSAGTYTFTAKAVDNQGASTTSTAVRVTIDPPPNQPPTVALTQPLDGAKFTAPATVNLAASASDPDGSIALVEFWNGTQKVGSSTTVPYAFSLKNLAAGAYTFTAKAVDNQGATTTSTAVRVTIDPPPNQPPTVALTQPLDGAKFTAPATINFTATASDPDGSIASVEFWNGTQKVGSSTAAPYAFSVKNLAAGSYTFTARAIDDRGATTTSTPVSVVVSVPKPPATISLVQPVDHSVGFAPEPITFAVALADLDSTVARVEYLSGDQIVATATNAPYSAAWIATEPGIYSFTARAVLATGGPLLSSPRTFTVGGHRAEIALVYGITNVESDLLQQTLLKLGHTVDLYPAGALGPDSLFGYRLAIWTDGGESSVAVLPQVIDAFDRANTAGTPTYFIGERLLAGVAALEPVQRQRWYTLLDATPIAGSPVIGADLHFESVADDHPLLRGRFGLVEEFHYTGALEPAVAASGDVESVVLALGRPVLTMSPAADSSDDSGRPHTVAQFFLQSRGLDATNLVSREALFGNAVDWLLGSQCFSQVVAVEQDAEPADPSAGQDLTLVLTAVTRGECGATGVTLIDSVPDSWLILSATASRGSVSIARGEVSFSIGRMPQQAPETLTLKLRPTVGGLYTNTVAIHWNEEPGVPLSSESVVQVVGSLIPGLTLQPDSRGHYILTLSAVPGLAVRVESSTDLKQWSPIQTFPGGLQTLDLGTSTGFIGRMYFRAVMVP